MHSTPGPLLLVAVEPCLTERTTCLVSSSKTTHERKPSSRSRPLIGRTCSKLSSLSLVAAATRWRCCLNACTKLERAQHSERPATYGSPSQQLEFHCQECLHQYHRLPWLAGLVAGSGLRCDVAFRRANLYVHVVYQGQLPDDARDVIRAHPTGAQQVPKQGLPVSVVVA